jgi:hypothetical protein
MKALCDGSGRRLSAWLFLGILFFCGCATAKIDWSKRIGTYTYDQAVLELGPPSKQAKLTDGTTVADWLTHRGYYYAYAPGAYGYGAWGYAPYVDTYRTPDSYLRLTFGPDAKLHSWKRIYQ